MDRIAANRRWAALGFILLSLLSRADAQTAIESRFCCSVSFEFSEVETYAHKILPDLPGPFSSVMIVAEHHRGKLAFAGTSEIDPSWCKKSAVGIRGSLSHAYLFKTPLGAGLHHWDSQTRSYRSTVLAGRDVFQEQFRAGYVAWLGGSASETPQLWLVAESSLQKPASLEWMNEILGLLRLTSADVYLRTDPYLWRPDRCGSFTAPSQWRPPFVSDDAEPSRLTIHCRVRPGLPGPECRTHRYVSAKESRDAGVQ